MSKSKLDDFDWRCEWLNHKLRTLLQWREINYGQTVTEKITVLAKDLRELADSIEKFIKEDEKGKENP